ncbi:MAG TPA: ATP-dependent RecD-like DNA helicase [Erysipelotrichaceae bacterium]|nr:MAG: conjugal transfer protein TraA [Firmicutes bacterium GWE2_51_13]HBZ40593.1 ATP-dependent RecD-like DNA helicase [Erysipelotrichaceae bacterium]
MYEGDEITGKIGTVIFRSESNSFTVAKFRLYELTEKDITITGYFPALVKDVLYTLIGEYKEHPRFGMQFVVQSARRVLPTDAQSVVAYLSSPLFPGIGRKYAQTVVETLGEQALYLLRDDPDLLDGIVGTTPKKKQAVKEGLVLPGDQEEAIRFFTTHGLGIRNIMRLDRIYGPKVLTLIQENPYRLVDEVDGIGFKTADKLGLSMGVELDDPRRVKAAATSCVMEECMRSGDSYVVFDRLVDVLVRQLYGIDFDPEATIDGCVEEGKLIREGNRIYHPTQFDSELTITRYFDTFPMSMLDPYDPFALDTGLAALQEAKGILYDESQVTAIKTFFDEPCTILTGGPGTGKTTVVGAMIALFKYLHPSASVACCAPTGRAAKRMSELTGADSFTIHSLLKWDLESNTFGKNETDPLSIDMIIIDEFSMVDPWLFAQLLKAGAQFKKILIVGDRDQLPPVAPGSTLRDLILSSRFPVIALSHIYRQKEGSDVIELAHRIRQGHSDASDFNKDIRWIPCDVHDVKNVILHVVNEALNKGYNVNDVQILAPKYSGVAGIDGLNHAMQKMVNPPDDGKREMKVGYVTYREQDKILQLKNQPTDDVYNGDIGTLIEIVPSALDENKQNRIIVDFDGRIVEYTSETFINITLAYCISVHKSQGSEYPIVLLPCVREYSNMLTRRLIYTAVTRASKALILIGEPEAFAKGVATQDKQPRDTTLTQRLNLEN